MTLPLYTQTDFRYRWDNGGETSGGATYMDAAHVNPTSVMADMIFRMRYAVQNTNNKSASNQGFPLEYNLNSGGWNAVGAGTPIAFVSSTYVANNDATTQQLSTGTFSAGSISDDGNANVPSFGANGVSDIEFVLIIDSSQVATGNTIQLRCSGLNAYTYTPTITVSEPSYDQDSYRFENDDGGEAASTWAGSLNTTTTLSVDTKYRLRVLVQNTDATAGTPSFHLQRNLNSGGWSDVLPASTVVQSTTSANTSWTISDGDATTQRVGSGTFTAGQVDTDGAVNTISVPASNETELVYIITIVSGDVANNDSITFRLVRANDQPLASITNTPTVTVSEVSQDVLTANDISTGTPTLSSPAIGQEHVLNANNITTGTPTLSTPTVAEVVPLTANDIASGTPTLTSPSIGQTHVLNANNLTSGTPTLSQPVLSQAYIIPGDFVDYPHKVGPYSDGNNNLYVICYTKSATTLDVFKSIDDGVSWIAKDTSNRPTTNGSSCIDSQYSAHNIYLAQHIGTAVRVSNFITSSAGANQDTWGTTDSAVTTGITNVTYPSVYYAILNGSGHQIIIYNTGSGPKYKLNTGTWGSELDLDTSITNSSTWIVGIVDSSYNHHIYYTDPSITTLYRVVFDSSGTKGSRSSVTTALKSGVVAPVIPPVWWDEG